MRAFKGAARFACNCRKVSHSPGWLQILAGILSPCFCYKLGNVLDPAAPIAPGGANQFPGGPSTRCGPPPFHGALRIRSYTNCRASPASGIFFLKYYFNFVSFHLRKRHVTAFFIFMGLRAPPFSHAVSPLLADLTKTAGVYPILPILDPSIM